MHGFHAGLARRLERLERRLAGVLEPETDGERARRLELVTAAHVGLVPDDLQAAERPVFSRIVASLPILQELRDEGIVGDDGEPGGDNPHHEEGKPVWEP